MKNFNIKEWQAKHIVEAKIGPTPGAIKDFVKLHNEYSKLYNKMIDFEKHHLVFPEDKKDRWRGDVIGDFDRANDWFESARKWLVKHEKK